MGKLAEQEGKTADELMNEAAVKLLDARKTVGELRSFVARNRQRAEAQGLRNPTFRAWSLKSVGLGEPGRRRLEHLGQRPHLGRQAASTPRTGPQGEIELAISPDILNESLRVLREKFLLDDADLQKSERLHAPVRPPGEASERLDVVQSDPTKTGVDAPYRWTRTPWSRAIWTCCASAVSGGIRIRESPTSSRASAREVADSGGWTLADSRSIKSDSLGSIAQFLLVLLATSALPLLPREGPSVRLFSLAFASFSASPSVFMANC